MDAAYQQHHLKVTALAESLNHLGNLLGKLTRRGQDQPLDGNPLGLDLGNERSSETDRLSCTGLRLADDVTATEDRFHDLLLDGRTIADPHRLEAGKDISR